MNWPVDQRIPRQLAGARHAVHAAAVFVVTIAVLASALAGAPARADSFPIDGLPETVTSDPLPTVQINGVVWAQVTVGNTVYATGQFSRARPAGVLAGGVGEQVRGNLLAYDITTGNLLPFNHRLDAVGRTIAASPDGTRLYVAGSFLKVDGIARTRLAAFDLTNNGALVSTFQPSVDNTVRAIRATNTTVYVGGDFLTADGSVANRVAAFSAADGARLAWAARASAGVTALIVSPDGHRVVIAGRFTKLNNAVRLGIGAVDATSGVLVSWSATFPTENTGPNASITSLTTDGTYLYATGYVFSSIEGNFEGRLKADFTGNVIWMDTCHGDSYDSFAQGDVLYTASHSHDCSDVGDFETYSNAQRAMAETTAATGILAHNNNSNKPQYRTDSGGRPAPSHLYWFPDLKPGTFTGQSQAAWSVTGTSTYVAFGGEFPTVNGIAQQGLVRFAKKAIAPNRTKPVSKAINTPVATSTVTGTVEVTWGSSWDNDNDNLTYALYRDNGPTPIHTITSASRFYLQPILSHTDVGLTPGTTHTYKVVIADPIGNRFTTFASNAVTVAGTGARTAWEGSALNDGATHLWPLSEATGSTMFDRLGGNDLTLVSSANATRNVAGPTAPANGTATRFNGTAGGTAASSAAETLSSVSVEAWFSTTSTTGGQVADYGQLHSPGSPITTNSLYLTPAGRAAFALWTSTGYRSVISPAAYNNGQWHHVVGTASPSGGVRLYVDGVPVASAAAPFTARPIYGYWHVAGDNGTWLPSGPANPFFPGSLADVAIYPTALPAATVGLHARGAGANNHAPTAVFSTSCGQLRCSVNGTASTDPDGRIANWSWDFADGTAASGATVTHTYSSPGAYTITLVVTDNSGLTATTTRRLVVS